MIKQGESLFYMGRLLKKEIFGLGAEEVVEDLSGFEFYLSLQTKDSEQLRLQGVKYDGYFTFEVDNTQSLSGNYNVEVGVMVEGKVLVCNKNKSLYVKKSILAQSLSSLEGVTDNSELTTSSDNTTTIITQSSDDSGQEMSKFLYRIELVESGSAINLNAWSDSSSIDAYLGLILKGEKGEAGEAQFTITMDGVSYQSSGGKVTLPYITCDSVPIEGSQRAVTSDGIYSADEAIREDVSWIKDSALPIKADKSDVYTKDEAEQNFVVLDGYVAYQETEKIKLAGIEQGAQVNPTTLPNPNELIINGVSYDGSEKKEIFITGSGDTVSWDTLPDKPDFADVAISGDYEDLKNRPIIDDTPTEDSINAVSSGGVYSALQNIEAETVTTSGSINSTGSVVSESDIWAKSNVVATGHHTTFYGNFTTNEGGFSTNIGDFSTSEGDYNTTEGSFYQGDREVAYKDEITKNLDITQFLLAETGTVTETYYNSLLSALGEMDKISVGGYANSTDIGFIVPITIAKDAGDNIVISFYFGLLMANSLTLITISSDYSWTTETVDLATKTYVTNAISNITIPSTEGLATETYVDESFDSINTNAIISQGNIKSIDGNIYTEDGALYTSDGDIYTTSGEIYNVDGDFKARNGSFYKGTGETAVEVAYKDELSDNNFTDELKTRLENTLSESEIEALIAIVQNELDTLVDGDTSSAIDTFNEIKEFLDGFTDTEDLSAVLLALKNEIIALIPDVPSWALESSKPSYDYSEINNPPTIPSIEGLSTESYVDQKTAYATQTTKGTARIWTTTEDDKLVLNIATED